MYVSEFIWAISLGFIKTQRPDSLKMAQSQFRILCTLLVCNQQQKVIISTYICVSHASRLSGLFFLFITPSDKSPIFFDPSIKMMENLSCDSSSIRTLKFAILNLRNEHTLYAIICSIERNDSAVLNSESLDILFC